MVTNIWYVAVLAGYPEQGDPLWVLSAAAYFLFAVIGFTAMMTWFYRATKNARAIASGVETRPVWAVGYFFVPVLSWFRPYRTMSEVWRTANLPMSWKGLNDPIILRIWWGGWLVGAIGGAIGSLREPYGGLFTSVSTIVGIAADLLFLYLARRIAAAQVANKDQSVFD